MRTAKGRAIVIDTVCFCIGAALYAAAICCLIKPNGLITGGATGIALMCNRLFHFPIGVSVLALNVPLFVISFRRLGKGFVLRSAAATALAALLIDFAGPLLPKLTLEPLLAALAGGITAGSGLALIFLRGGSTGGADIIGKLVNAALPHLPVGRVMMVVDLAVITMFAALFGGIPAALYSAVMIGVSTAAIDYLLYGVKSGKILLVVTKQGARLAEAVNVRGNRGATIVPVIGAYSKQNISMVMIALKNHEIGHIYRMIYQLDPEAFVTLSDARQITGRGFNHNE